MDYGSHLPTNCRQDLRSLVVQTGISHPSNNYLDNQWHHAVVTFDNTNNIVKLFVDGLQVGTLSTTSNPDNTGTQPLRIGENSQSPLGPDAFIGQLDEVGVWNKALPDAEVISLMNLRVSQFPISGLVYSNSFGTPTPENVTME